MKRTFTILVMLTICVSSYAQKKDSTVSALKDTTKFLSLSDINRIMLTPEKKKSISVADWETFWAVLNNMLLPQAIKEYEEKHKAKR